MSAVDHLRRIPLLSDLTAEEMIDVLRMATVVQFAPEQRICAHGSAADGLFILEEGEGSVRVGDTNGRTREVSRIGAGEVFGELGLVDGQVRSADVIALTAVRAYRLERVEFDRMRAAMHPAAYKMLRRIALTVSARLRAINAAISDQLAPPGEAPRASRVAPEPRVSRVTVERVSRVNTAPIAAAPIATPREPQERSLLRSVLARFSGGGK
jgi:CRP-like cAMP-binding protein